MHLILVQPPIIRIYKLGQSCAKLCSSFGSFASNIYTLTGGWVAGWVTGWVVQL